MNLLISYTSILSVVVVSCEDDCFITVDLSVDVRELVIDEDADGCLAEVGAVAGAAFLTGDGCLAAVTLVVGAGCFTEDEAGCRLAVAIGAWHRTNGCLAAVGLAAGPGCLSEDGCLVPATGCLTGDGCLVVLIGCLTDGCLAGKGLVAGTGCLSVVCLAVVASVDQDGFLTTVSVYEDHAFLLVEDGEVA